MYKINDNYQKLPGSYLFSTIAKKVNAYSEANPDKKIIRLGIGDALVHHGFDGCQIASVLANLPQRVVRLLPVFQLECADHFPSCHVVPHFLSRKSSP